MTHPFKSNVSVHLGGGGFRGYCHFTVVEIIKRFTNITSLSGFSIGALVGYILSFRHVNTQSAQEMFLKLYPKSLHYQVTLSNLFGNKSLCDISVLMKFIRALCTSLNVPIDGVTLQDAYGMTNMEFKIITSDITSFLPVVHDRHNNTKDTVLDVITASMCYPGVFPPMPLSDGKLHYDGGLLGAYINPWSGLNIIIRFANKLYDENDILHQREQEFAIGNDWKGTSHMEIALHVVHRLNCLLDTTKPSELTYYINVVMPKKYTTFSTIDTLEDTDLKYALFNSECATILALRKMFCN